MMQPESTEALIRRICRALSWADGFALYFVLVNLPTARKALSLQVQEQLGRPVIELDVPPEGFGDTTLDGWLLPKLKELEKLEKLDGVTAESPIFLHGLDRVMPSGQAGLSRFLQQLNWRRSALKRIARPLVIWLPRHALNSMAEHAPDLYDWYSNVYEFASPKEEAEELRSGFVTEFDTAVHPADRQSKVEKEQWLHTLTTLLDEHPQRNTYRAKLLNDAGEVHYASGNLEDALKLYQQSLAISQELGDKAGEGRALNNISQIYAARGDYTTATKTLGSHFNSKDGEQNIAQGDHAIGQQVNTQQASGDESILSGTGNVAVNYYSIPPAVFAEYAGKLAVTDAALASFFKIMEEQQVPPDDLGSKLREIAGQHKELMVRLETVQSEDPQVQRLKEEAGQAIEAADYAKAEELLNQAEARDMQAIEQLEEAIKQQQDAARQRRISAAASCEDNAKLQRIQLRYAKAAEYWQKAAALLPENKKKERSLYLHEAGDDLHRIARYSEALSLFEQSLAIDYELGDKAGEGTTLNNISHIYKARGDYLAALKYLEQSLAIRQEIDDKAGEGATLNNIGHIYKARGDYLAALRYLEQSLAIRQEIDDKAGEGATLNNIGLIYDAQGNSATALKYLEQSLAIRKEIGDKTGEGTTLNNISGIHRAQGDYATALKYLKQSAAIFLVIGDKAHEGGTLNNIGQIYKARGDYLAALKYLEQSLSISQEIGDRRQEGITSWNIGLLYKDQGDLTKAEQYMSRAVQLAEEIGHPKLEEWREGLATVRAETKGR
jgi:tetratricopeptide (TPR) repeat protein